MTFVQDFCKYPDMEYYHTTTFSNSYIIIYVEYQYV